MTLQKEKDKKQEDLREDEDRAEQPSGPEEACDDSPAESEADGLQKQFDELNDRYLRVMAEYDNFRKRSAREREELYPAATAAAVEKFLPVLDNLERAEQYEPGTEEFAKGFEMICQNFREIVVGFGVQSIGEVGEPFDPELHNAVMHIEDENFGENVVSQVLQKGYRIGGKVIRYAMVQTAN